MILFPRNSYGAFNLDLERRLNFEVSAAVNTSAQCVSRSQSASIPRRAWDALTTGIQLIIEALPAKS